MTIHCRPEEAWAGTFRAEYYNGANMLASVNLPMNSSKDSATGRGQKTVFNWDLSSVVKTAAVLGAGRVRFVNTSTNGKKVWVAYSILNANFASLSSALAMAKTTSTSDFAWPGVAYDGGEHMATWFFTTGDL